MLHVLIIVACAITVTIFIWRRNRDKGQVREASWAIVILWGAAALQIAIARHLPVSLPTDWISMLLEPIYVPIVAWLKGG
ncbi:MULTISPECIES: hypothetical protein [Paenibacillus]|jgi:hypothetical protein|uniref:hypothetical protein n=1 Tax=Paenibacillus TaxID=44249 RepID=UPI00164D7AF1|nr:MULTISPECIES: hypothetical protein [Paenibacillus]QNK58302.1 hypothetical protein H7F31_05030 [Paenibacillus sp. PAMC21692]